MSRRKGERSMMVSKFSCEETLRLRHDLWQTLHLHVELIKRPTIRTTLFLNQNGKTITIHSNGQGESIIVEQRRQPFDLILKQIYENKNLLYDVTFIKEIVEFIVHSNEKSLYGPTMINHFKFITTLACWRKT